jgi:hypothetical protein
MIYKHIKHLSLFLVLFIFAHNTWSENHSINIQEAYLRKFPSVVLTSEELQKNEMQKQKMQMQLPFWPIQIETKKLTEKDQLRTFFAHIRPHHTHFEHIINMQVIDKLNILYSKTTNTETKNTEHIDGFADKIAKLAGSSLLGQLAFGHELSNPTNNVQVLYEKQAIIKDFMSGKLHILSPIMQKTLLYEESIAHLWANGHELVPEVLKQNIYWSNGGVSSKLLPTHVTNYLDKKPIALLPMIIDIPLTSLGTGVVIGGTFSIATAIYHGQTKHLLNTIKEGIQSTGSLLKDSVLDPIQTTKTVGLFIKNTAINAQNGFKQLPIQYQILIPYGFYCLGMVTYNIENQFAHLQKYFIDFAKNNLNFSLAFPELQYLIDLDNKAKHSADFNQLVALLKTGTFKGKASKLSYLGRVKCAYKLFMNVRQEFEPILYAMAKLQMYDGVAQLMKESATKENTFCFAEFVDYGPYVEAVDFWNPMVGQEKAISNSLIMTPNQKDIILHGPNTGGKTTTIKGLMYNILLAQTLGIASASQLIVSPFAQINCFMDIQDDVSAGFSLFDAEVRFATELHNNVKSLKTGEYAFTIADEILRSTSPSKGQACAYQFTKKLAKHPHSMSITVTHYPKLVELATEMSNNGFRTFHVEIKRENGKVIRTFKLKEGATTENIAGDILQEHGIFDADDLKEVGRLEEDFGQ